MLHGQYQQNLDLRLHILTNGLSNDYMIFTINTDGNAKIFNQRENNWQEIFPEHNNHCEEVSFYSLYIN